MTELPGFSHRYYEVEGIRLHYAEGPANGKQPLVLVPAQSMPWDSYAKVLPALAKDFHCYVTDVRGHGLSAHTPGEYRFSRLGKDLAVFLRDVVREPALLTGNSSGGIIIALAANEVPELVSGLLMEDPPWFSSEWPRLSTCYAHHLFASVVRHIDKPERDVAGFFAELDVPSQNGIRVMRLPRFVAKLMGWLVARHQRRYPGQPVDLPVLPFQLRIFVRALSEYDPAFTRAFWDGSACDIDHARVLAGIRCPAVLVSANHFMHERLGLVGAMSDDDISRVLALLPNGRHVDEPSGHVIHQERPRRFNQLLTEFAASLRAR